jgi:hypothetical protein
VRFADQTTCALFNHNRQCDGAFKPQERKNPGHLRDRGFYLKPGSDLLSHGETPHYHRRCTVSLLSSGWDQVVPMLYCRQANWLKIWDQGQVTLEHAPSHRSTVKLDPDPNIFIFGLIDQALGCQFHFAQRFWVLYGQAARAISTG